MGHRAMLVAGIGLLACALMLLGCTSQQAAPVAQVPSAPTSVAQPTVVAPTTAPPTLPLTPVPPTPTATSVPPTPTVTSIPPTPTVLSKTRLEITSIPTGSEVYVASLSDIGLKVGNDGNKDVTIRRLLGLNRLSSAEDMFKVIGVADSKYRRGVTPVSLSLPAGNYGVFVEMPSSVKPPSDNPLAWLENDSTHGQRVSGITNGHNGVAYLVEVIEGETNHLTQLWQPKRASLDEIEKLYPEKESFSIDEQDISTNLKDKIPANDLPTVLRLLRKGGKAVYRQGNTRTIMELDAQGKLGTLLRVEDK